MTEHEAQLHISYSGPAVRVHVSKITRAMNVPLPGPTDLEHGDEPHGRAAVELFELAIAARALVMPAGLTVECYADDDEDGGGFILAIYPVGERCGVTRGWRSSDYLTIDYRDGRADNDRAVVADALRGFASELNAMLGIQPAR